MNSYKHIRKLLQILTVLIWRLQTPFHILENRMKTHIQFFFLDKKKTCVISTWAVLPWNHLKMKQNRRSDPTTQETRPKNAKHKYAPFAASCRVDSFHGQIGPFQIRSLAERISAFRWRLCWKQRCCTCTVMMKLNRMDEVGVKKCFTHGWI